jgi:hypothetical protein
MISIVSIVFRYLNFLVLVACGKYIFSAYVIPSVKKMMHDLSIYLQNLQQDANDVKKSVGMIRQQIKDQQLLFDAMQNKFVTWQKNRAIIAQNADQDRKKYVASMQQRSATRSICLQSNKALQKELPAILNSVTVQLQKKYDNELVGQKYIDELLQEMKDVS